MEWIQTYSFQFTEEIFRANVFIQNDNNYVDITYSDIINSSDGDIIGKKSGILSFFVKDEVEKKDSREIRIKFLSQVNESAPVNFFPSSNEVRVWTDKVSKTSYIAENTTDKQLTLTIIPSVSPGLAAENVKKIQCFCFEEQVLMPYERQEWPVRFYVSSEVGDNVNDIYLSYTLFETDRVLTDNMNHGK